MNETDTSRILEDIPYLNNNNFKELLHMVYKNGPDENIEKLSDSIFENLNKYEINTELRLSHFLSQIGHESGELRYTEEIASGHAYEGRKDLGNTYPGDGKRFKGRGLIQLTGRYNYTRFSEYLNNSTILEQPDIISQDNNLTVLTAFYYWNRTKLNNFADRDNIRQVTRKINGGYNGLSDRIRLYDLTKHSISKIRIKTIQQLLNTRYNSDLVEDGIYGPNTEKALVSNNLTINNWTELLG